MGEILPFTGARVANMTPNREAEKVILSCLAKGRTRPQEEKRSGAATLEGEERRKNILDRIDQIRHLIAQGRIEDFLFVGRDVETKHFLTEIALSPSNRTDIFAFVGITNALKLELTERAQLAPTLLPDGSVLDPYQDEEALP